MRHLNGTLGKQPKTNLCNEAENFQAEKAHFQELKDFCGIQTAKSPTLTKIENHGEEEGS